MPSHPIMLAPNHHSACNIIPNVLTTMMIQRMTLAPKYNNHTISSQHPNHNCYIPGSDLGKPNIGIESIIDIRPITRKPIHQAPTQVGSPGDSFIL